jgi:hypothetical protein
VWRHEADLTWWGKQQRLRACLDDFESARSELCNRWPDRDGTLSTIGTFMAYPVGRPTVLILLISPPMPRSGIAFSAIERGASGALRFQLKGTEQGAWVEWHPRGQQPASFVGGLMDRHEIERVRRLGGNWYVVGYSE